VKEQVVDQEVQHYPVLPVAGGDILSDKDL